MLDFFRNLIGDLQNRGCEKVFYWRCLAQFVQTEAGLKIDQIDEIMDRLLPSLLPLADFVFAYVPSPSGTCFNPFGTNRQFFFRKSVEKMLFLVQRTIISLFDFPSRLNCSQIA